MTIELADSGENFSEENQAFILLNFVLELCRDVKNVLRYGRDGLKFDIVIFALGTRDVELKKGKRELGKRDKKECCSCDALYTRRRSTKGDKCWHVKKNGNIGGIVLS